MSLVTCPDCGASISDTAPACVHCGRPQTPSATAVAPQSLPGSDVANIEHTGSAGAQTEFPFFPVATHKFVVLSICTFGIYAFYWAYKNWQRIRSASGETLSPFWRAFFAPLWGFSLFRRIRDHVTNEGVAAGWSPPFLATCYLLLSASWQLPDPWWLISLATFVPLIPVQQATQRFNEQRHVSENPNSSYTGVNVVAIVFGGILVIFGVIGTFFPE